MITRKNNYVKKISKNRLDKISFVNYDKDIVKKKKGVNTMTNENAVVVQTIATALSLMPEEKRRFIMGYAEAVIDMRSEQFAARQQARSGERREGA